MKDKKRSRALEVLAERVYRRSRSKGSVKAYTWGVRRFCDFMGEEPDGLISKLARGELAMERSLNEWLDKLDNEGDAPNMKHLCRKIDRVTVQRCFCFRIGSFQVWIMGLSLSELFSSLNIPQMEGDEPSWR